MNALTTPEGAPLDLDKIVQEVTSGVSPYRGLGAVASYIPALAKVDPKKFGIAIALGDGSTFAAGDADEPFSIQSIATVFSLGLALGRVRAALWNHVGREPSGSPFNSIVQLEADKGKPRNPMINAGAIVVCDQLMGGAGPDVALAELTGFLDQRCGGCVTVDEEVASSESRSGSLNRSLAHFLKAYANLENPVEDVLSLYFRQCAIAMSCRQLARSALYLAFDGTDPLTGREVMIPSRSRRINSLMLTCGHYDVSGDFAFRIGLPGKSGVGGGILTIVPGVGSVVVWSPGLNTAGTSLAGTEALAQLVELTGWSLFA